MTELNAISKSVIHAFLARLPHATTSLAGFNVAFTAYYACSSATEVSYLVTLSWLRDRRSIIPLLRFFCLITAGPVALAWTVAFTAAGDCLYGGLFGASPAVVREAKLATFVFSLSAPFLIARALTFGVLMINRRTMLISWSTLARLASLGGSLVLLPRFVSGRRQGRPPSSPAWRWRRSSPRGSRRATSGRSRRPPVHRRAFASCGVSRGR